MDADESNLTLEFDWGSAGTAVLRQSREVKDATDEKELSSWTQITLKLISDAEPDRGHRPESFSKNIK